MDWGKMLWKQKISQIIFFTAESGICTKGHIPKSRPSLLENPNYVITSKSGHKIIVYGILFDRTLAHFSLRKSNIVRCICLLWKHCFSDF